jgi:hypothetical protein
VGTAHRSGHGAGRRRPPRPPPQRRDPAKANLALNQAYHATSTTGRGDVLPAGRVKLTRQLRTSLSLGGDLSYVRATQAPRSDIGVTSGDQAEMPPLRTRPRLRWDDGRAVVEAEAVASSTSTAASGIASCRLPWASPTCWTRSPSST